MPTSLTADILASNSFSALATALEPVSSWSYSEAEQASAIQHAKSFITEFVDSECLCGFFVTSYNEWAARQPRLLIVSSTASYRVDYSATYGGAQRQHAPPLLLSQIDAVEKLDKAFKLYNIDSSRRGLLPSSSSRYSKRDEVYAPHAPDGMTEDELVDIILAVYRKACELASQSMEHAFPVPMIIHSEEERKQYLATRRSKSARRPSARASPEGMETKDASAPASAIVQRRDPIEVSDAEPVTPSEGPTAAEANETQPRNSAENDFSWPWSSSSTKSVEWPWTGARATRGQQHEQQQQQARGPLPSTQIEQVV